MDNANPTRASVSINPGGGKARWPNEYHASNENQLASATAAKAAHTSNRMRDAGVGAA